MSKKIIIMLFCFMFIGTSVCVLNTVEQVTADRLFMGTEENPLIGPPMPPSYKENVGIEEQIFLKDRFGTLLISSFTETKLQQTIEEVKTEIIRLEILLEELEELYRVCYREV